MGPEQKSRVSKKSSKQKIISKENKQRSSWPVKKKVKGVQLVQTRKVIRNINVALTPGAFHYAILNPKNTKPLFGPPTGWPQELPWKPNRHFGVFWSGSELSQIELVVTGASTALWYHNDFFVNQQESDYFQPFYDEQLPTNKTQIPFFEAGAIPEQDGAGWILFSLQRISYTSRYGGSIELLFRSKHDVGIEFRKEQILWDVKDLLIKIFIVPHKQGLTHPADARHLGKVVCEFIPDVITTYSITTQQAISEDHSSEITELLSILAQKVAKGIQEPARQLVNGFLWAQFPDLLGPQRVVEGIDISDNYIDLYTRHKTTNEGIPECSVQFQVRNVASTIIELDPEFELTLSSTHVWSNGITQGPSITDRVYGGCTCQVLAGQWTLDEIDQLQSILLRVEGAQLAFEPGGAGESLLQSYETQITLNNIQLRAAHQSAQYGIVETRLINASANFEDYGWVLLFDLVITISINLR